MSIDEGISFGLYKAFQGSLTLQVVKQFVHSLYKYFVGRNQLDSCLVFVVRIKIHGSYKQESEPR